MTAGEIERCREELQALRRRLANVKREEVERLALSLGWQFRPKKGGHPRYDKAGRAPLTIPGHRTFKKYTLAGILDYLEEDLDREEEEARDGN